MADEKTTKEVPAVTDKKDQQKVDLPGLLSWVQKQKESTKKEEKKESGSTWGIIIAVISAAVVFIGMAIIAWHMWKNGAEIARLKHKIDVDNEEKKRAEAQKEISKNEAEIKELAGQAAILESKIESSKRQILVIEDQRQKAHAAIDKVTSWEDVDALLKK